MEEPTRWACFQLNTEWMFNVWLKFLTVLKFKQRKDMANQKQNVIDCMGCSKYSDLIVVHDTRSARSNVNLLKLDPGCPGSGKIFSVRDPRSLGSQGNTAVTGSKIFGIPWKNYNIRSKILQDPGSWILEIQDIGSFWDLGACLALMKHCVSVIVGEIKIPN